MGFWKPIIVYGSAKPAVVLNVTHVTRGFERLVTIYPRVWLEEFARRLPPLYICTALLTVTIMYPLLSRARAARHSLMYRLGVSPEKLMVMIYAVILLTVLAPAALGLSLATATLLLSYALNATIPRSTLLLISVIIALGTLVYTIYMLTYRLDVTLALILLYSYAVSTLATNTTVQTLLNMATALVSLSIVFLLTRARRVIPE